MRDIYSEKSEAKTLLAIKYITEHPEIIPLLKDKYVTDDILEQCIQIEPEVFRYIKNPSLKIIAVALDIDGGNVRYIPKKRLATLPEETLLLAFESNFDAAVEYREDMQLSDIAQMDIFQKDPIKALENGIKVPEYYVINELRKTPNMIRYVPNANERMKCEALKFDPNVALYYDVLSDAMMDIIDEKYPYLANVLPNYTRKRNTWEEKENGSAYEETEK